MKHQTTETNITTEQLAEIAKTAQELEKNQTRLQKIRKKITNLNKEAKEAKKQILREKVMTDTVSIPKSGQPDNTTVIPAPKVVQKIKKYEWTAPIRIKYSFDMRTFFVITAISLVFSLYLAVLGQDKYLLILVILALLFLIYAGGVLPPVKVTHTITGRGIDTMGKSFDWNELSNFRFTKKHDAYIMYIATKRQYPAELLLIVPKDELKTIYKLLEDKLLYKVANKQSKWDRLIYGTEIPLEDLI